MRAVAVIELKGTPQVLDLPRPVPRSDQVLVKVAATSINPYDWQVADGAFPGMPNVLPFVMGADASGTVIAIGSGVSNIKVGERIFGQFFHSPLGEGTYAEYAVAPAAGALAPLPDSISDEVGAALPTAAMTAMGLVDRVGAGPGGKLLIVGATGGVGSFVTQLAALKGLDVLVTASPADAERMRGLGASRAFDHHQSDLADQLQAAYPDGIDAVIDLVSKPDALVKLSTAVRRGGDVLSTTGAADAKDLQTRGLKGGNFVLDGSPSLLARLVDLVETSRLNVPIEATVSLDEAPAAIAKNRKGGARGKTIIRL